MGIYVVYHATVLGSVVKGYNGVGDDILMVLSVIRENALEKVNGIN